MTTVVLLAISNIFMTFAWYGHLKYLHDKPLWITVAISWGIAFFEYCLMVPANRLGYGKFTGYELKILQEVITLVVFVGFAWLVLGEKLRWNYAVSLALIFLAVWFAFGFKPAAPTS
ncbi:DMT family protein [Oleiharenicola sp. Vm1]|uniref:DMT family protein n=1 Tax=Oleiharenicola sp. Vm1 TaxID=3398393 RepID=UPI0039F5266A